MNLAPRSDPLLRGTRLLLVITMGLAVVFGIGLCAAIPSVWMFSNRVVVEAAQNWALGSAMAVLLILVITATIAVGALIVWLILLPIRRRNRLVLGDAPPAPADPPAPAAERELAGVQS